MAEQEQSRPEAKLLEPQEEAGQLWWGEYLRGRVLQINKRFRSGGTVYWAPAEKMPLDLFSYIREASLCFSVARFLATMVLSSGAVELVLNRDRRTRKLDDMKRLFGWAMLNNHNLNLAASAGLPVQTLLSSGESLADEEPIRFVRRRNKVAHGEISDWIRDLSDYDPSAELEALDQLKKSQSFIVEWFNGSPDVHECSIQNHEWPEPGN